MVLFTWAIGIVTTITQFIRPPPYSLSDTSVSLFYFAPILGSILAEFWGHWFNDFLFNRYAKTHRGVHQPENRLWAVYLGSLLSFISLILYGQTLQKELPVVGLAFSWAMMAFAQVVVVSAISAYVLDCFPEHAALASSWVNFWRTTGTYPLSFPMPMSQLILRSCRRILCNIFPNSVGCQRWSCCNIRCPSRHCWRGSSFSDSITAPWASLALQVLTTIS